MNGERLESLRGDGLPPEAAVLDASHPPERWEEGRALLLEAFRASQAAAQAEAPIVYIVHGDDLLGRRGTVGAMVATGLLSAARTAAIELSRKATVANVIAVGDDTPDKVTDRWILALSASDGPTGEIVRLDAGHLGKALP